MENHGTQKDQHLSLPAQTPFGTTPAALPANAVHDIQLSGDDSTDTSIGGLQAAHAPHRDDNSMTTSLSAGISSSPGTQSPKAVFGNRKLIRSKTKEEKRAAKEKKDKHAQNPHNDDQTVNDSTEDTLEAYTTPRPPPLSRIGTSFANATKASRGWETGRYEFSPSLKSSWIPAGSPSVSRPGSANKSLSFDLFGRTGSQNGQRSRRAHDRADRGSSESESQPMATGLDLIDVEPLYEWTESPVEDIYPTEYDEPVDVERLQIKFSVAEADRSSLREELIEMRTQFDYLCTAWLEVCDAASVSAKAVAYFHFLVTDSVIDEDSQVAAYEELTINNLRRWVNIKKKEIEDLQLELSSKDEELSAMQAELESHHVTPVNNDPDAQDNPTDWKVLYEEEHKRFESLSTQHKRLKVEAERMYQPDLGKKIKELQSELVAAEDSKVSLADEIRQAQEQAQAWRDEAELRKEELANCAVQIEEQVQLQNEEMMSAIKEYRGKVEAAEYWDKDGLISKNEQLEREQAVLVKEIERLLRANDDQNDRIKSLIKIQRQDQRTRYTGYAADLQAVASTETFSKQDEMEKLREKQRKRMEEEDAEEALREKARRLKMGDQYHRESVIWQVQPWWKRWSVNESTADLTTEERAQLIQIKKTIRT